MKTTPAPGVLDCNNLPDQYIFDVINEGIDLRYQEALHELKGKFEDLDQYEEAVEELNDSWDSDYACRLVGDWKKTQEGRFEIDTKGKHGWAATYSNENGCILVVEYSKHTTRCVPTSLCYRRADTGGPCGDLDSQDPNGEIEAYTLPRVFFEDS